MMKLFEKWKTYFSITRKGDVKLFCVTSVLKRKSTGERVYVVGSYNGKQEKRYEIHNPGEDEWIQVDARYCTVIDATEWKTENKQ